MITRTFAPLTAVVVALAGNTNAFSPNVVKPIRMHTSTKLNSHTLGSDDDALFVMMKANACAHSDSCSIDEAENYLNEVMHLQSDCVTGSLESSQICDDVLYPSEVIGALRKKIEDGPKSLAAANLLNPAALSFAAVYLAVGVYILQAQNPGVEPFTAQEWGWSIRDGYFGDMVMQSLRHGGLLSVDEISVTPFTPQEWWWALRDGYLPEMLSQFSKNGGLAAVADASLDDTLISPFTAEEWQMAVKDGYVSDMISHYMRHGGL